MLGVLIMSKKLFYKNNYGVHLVNPLIGDTTFCGQPLEGHDDTDVATVTSSPVTCQDCIILIEYARGVRLEHLTFAGSDSAICGVCLQKMVAGLICVYCDNTEIAEPHN